MLYDPLMEEVLIDRYPRFCCFAGIDLIDGRRPDQTMILNFRYLEERQIAEQVLERVNQGLSKKGFLLKAETILDPTIIQGAHLNQEQEREALAPGRWVLLLSLTPRQSHFAHFLPVFGAQKNLGSS